MTYLSSIWYPRWSKKIRLEISHKSTKNYIFRPPGDSDIKIARESTHDADGVRIGRVTIPPIWPKPEILKQMSRMPNTGSPNLKPEGRRAITTWLLVNIFVCCERPHSDSHLIGSCLHPRSIPVACICNRPQVSFPMNLDVKDFLDPAVERCRDWAQTLSRSKNKTEPPKFGLLSA